MKTYKLSQMPHLFAIDLVKEKISKLSPDDRLKFINDIMYGYCDSCGQKDDNKCRCWDDE